MSGRTQRRALIYCITYIKIKKIYLNIIIPSDKDRANNHCITLQSDSVSHRHDGIIFKLSLISVSSQFFPAYPASQGVASFAYQDSSGNRYGGTYDLNDKLVRNSDLFTPFNDISSFYPNYFTNYDNIIQQ